MSCGTELRGWFREAEGANGDVSLGSAGAFATKEGSMEKMMGSVGDALS